MAKKNLNLDLSLDYSKNKFESKDQNRPTSLKDCRNNTEVNLLLIEEKISFNFLFKNSLSSSTDE